MKYSIYLNINDFDKHGLKLYGYPKLYSNLAFEHLKETDQGVGVLIQDRYAWVLISMKLKINKPLLVHEDIFGTTWYSGQRGPYHRREVDIFNDNAHIQGASYSILMDMKDRSVYRSKELPFNRLTEKLTHLVELNTNFKNDLEVEDIFSGKVLNSDIDILGHVNHLKYVEYIYNSITQEEIEKLKNYNTLELYFQKEMVLGDEYKVSKGYLDEKVVFIITNKTNNKRAFTLVLSNE